MGNLGFYIISELFWEVIKVSLLSSVGILLILAISPMLDKKHTVFWRYVLFLFLAARLALPFDISVSGQAMVIPLSESLGAGGQDKAAAPLDPNASGGTAATGQGGSILEEGENGEWRMGTPFAGGRGGWRMGTPFAGGRGEWG